MRIKFFIQNTSSSVSTLQPCSWRGRVGSDIKGCEILLSRLYYGNNGKENYSSLCFWTFTGPQNPWLRNSPATLAAPVYPPAFHCSLLGHHMHCIQSYSSIDFVLWCWETLYSSVPLLQMKQHFRRSDGVDNFPLSLQVHRLTVRLIDRCIPGNMRSAFLV